MNTQTLIASLTAVSPDADGVDFGADGVIDWSTRDGERRAFDVSGDVADAVLWLTDDQLRQLHTALTLTLLRDAQ